MPPLIFRKGLGLKHEILPMLTESYHSEVVADIKNSDFCYQSGRLTLHLAREFGFCYGVDRAVDYAYQTRKRFPDRRVFLTGEIIHNPHVNDQLRAQDIRFLSDADTSVAELNSSDVVILPAFGVTIEVLLELERRGCTLVDTTCGSVLNVWKNVRRYAKEGFTSVIHGKRRHEETQATASQAMHAGEGRYLIVLDREEATLACDYIRNRVDRAAFLERFREATSPDFDPDRDLERIGCANQTTMLSSESLVIGEMFREAVSDRYGLDSLAHRFQTFDTICSATQDRQDAVLALLDEQVLDFMLVVGGYNSSNTTNLARLCATRVPTYHLAEPGCLVSTDEIRHKPVGQAHEISTPAWLPGNRGIRVGLTAGASTPDNLVGQAVTRLATLVG